jgi:hypothetical protein
MRATFVLVLGVLVGVMGCAHVDTPHPSIAAPPPLASVEAAPLAIPLSEVGKDADGVDSIDLAMPADARVLTFARQVARGRETWTLAEHGPRRVLRLRFEDEKKRVTHAAWVGSTTKDGKDVRIDLRLVEQSGPLDFAPERGTATCARETVCEDGKPKHKVAATMCAFRDETSTSEEVAYFAPGAGVDFALGPCPHYEPTAPERLMKRPRMPMAPAGSGF